MENQKDKLKREACPDEMRMSLYVLHKCSREERQEIEAHLIKCPLCRKEAALLTKAQPGIEHEEEWGELPEWMYAKGMELVESAQGTKRKAQRLAEIPDQRAAMPSTPFEIFLQFIRGHWKIIRHSGEFVSKPVLASRGEIPGRKIALPPLTKKLRGYSVEVNLSENAEGTVDLEAIVKKFAEEELVSQVRFILKDEGKQTVLTDLIQDGIILFTELTPGTYSLEIAHEGKNIGDIQLNLKKE